ncbi:MAG: hypothetical protein NTV34_21115, partial [Proteobacteria bacterium]|nr:hypothetical protein [Pseudomonadota bacterium]
EGLDADIPQMQCVSGYIPHGGPVSCAADNNTPKSQFADLCTSVGGKPIGCFGGLNSMCDIDIRQKIVLSGKFEGFDENGNQVKCENYQSGGASTCGGSFYGMVCESEGLIAFPNCKKSCGKLCSTKLSSKFP